MHFVTQCLQCKQNQINEGYKQAKAETSLEGKEGLSCQRFALIVVPALGLGRPCLCLCGAENVNLMYT